MGKKSRAELIADLKSAGTRGSLSKMNLQTLRELHASITTKPEEVPETVVVQKKQAVSSTGKKPLLIEPDADDISEYLSGGSWWHSLASDVTHAAKSTVSGVEKGAKAVGSAVAKGASEFQKSEIGKDIELGAVDVGEVGVDVVGDAALVGSTTLAANPELGAAASAGLDVATDETADALRQKIRDS